MKLLELYTSVLKFCGFTVDEHGFIYTELDNHKDPAFINGMRMILPKDEVLRRFNPSEQIVFHPLTENILRGESDVVQHMKRALNIKLNFTIGMVGQELLRIVASQALHAKLTPEQAEILLQIKDCDEKAVTNFTSLMLSRINQDAERTFVNIYLKRGGTFKEKRYSRVGIVSFPLFADLLEDKVEKIRVKDNTTYQQLFNYMFPGLDRAEEYNFGSDSTVAPYLEALLRSAANVASRLNDLIMLYKEHIDGGESLMFDADWIDAFSDLNALVPEIRRIPVQAGNDGSLNVNNDGPSVGQAARQQLQQQHQQLNAPQMAPAMYAPMAPAAPEVKKTRRGLDFSSMVQASPVLAMTPNPLAPQMMMTQMQQQTVMDANRVPTWAQPAQPMGMMAPQQIMMTPQGPMVMMPNGAWVPAQMPPQQPPPWIAGGGPAAWNPNQR